MHVDAEVQTALPKPIIRPWEELVNNKNKAGIGYDQDVSFHIADYSKPIQFQSAGFLQGSSSSPVPTPQQQIVKCQRCDRVGHVKDNCTVQALWSTHSFFKHMLQKQTSGKNKDSPWMCRFLLIGFNNQEDISVTCQNFF